LAFAAAGASVVVNDLGGSRGGEGASTRAADVVVEEIRYVSFICPLKDSMKYLTLNYIIDLNKFLTVDHYCFTIYSAFFLILDYIL
jgi:hypothetical protein